MYVVAYSFLFFFFFLFFFLFSHIILFFSLHVLFKLHVLMMGMLGQGMEVLLTDLDAFYMFCDGHELPHMIKRWIVLYPVMHKFQVDCSWRTGRDHVEWIVSYPVMAAACNKNYIFKICEKKLVCNRIQLQKNMHV